MIGWHTKSEIEFNLSFPGSNTHTEMDPYVLTAVMV